MKIKRDHEEIDGGENASEIAEGEIEEAKSQDEEEEHFQVGRGPEEQGIVEQDLDEGELGENQKENDLFVEYPVYQVIDEVEKPGVDQELEQKEGEVIGSQKVPDKRDAKVLQRAVVPARVEEKEGGGFGVLDFERLERFQGVVRHEEKARGMGIIGDADDDQAQKTEKKERLTTG
jgi:hypothetical protein